MAAAILVFIGNVIWGRSFGPAAADDPWGGPSLEWATTSPPPSYNFDYLPIVEGRYPLWARQGEGMVVSGLRINVPEVLITTVLDSQPDHRWVLPGPSIAFFGWVWPKRRGLRAEHEIATVA
jgi:cytochrome c oxidase subunit I+III